MTLGRIQAVSLATKAVTLALGVAQALLVVAFLSKAEYGLVGLVISIGSVIGAAQHLGIMDGAIREIAVLKGKREIGTVFWASHVLRQSVTIPLTGALVALAGTIAARIYGRPEITPYIQLFAVSLILQGVQDVLGAALTGMKKFAALYAGQIITAVINVAAFGYLTWRFGVSGFFWAVLLTTSVMIALYGWVIARELGTALRLPRLADVRTYAKRLLRVAGYMYVSRMLFVVWQRLPLLLLGGVVAADALGEINLALTFGSKLTIIAMALSEVNLSWMSTLFAAKREEFTAVVTRNLQRVLLFMMAITLVLIFFVPEILLLPPLREYLPARSLVVVITMAFFLYALTDIGTSSVFVPADKPRLRAGVFAFMTGLSAAIIAALLAVRPDALQASFGMLAGAAAAYVAMALLAQRRFAVRLLTRQLGVFVILLLLAAGWLLMEPALPMRMVVFLGLSSVIIWETWHSKLLPHLPPFFGERLKTPLPKWGEGRVRGFPDGNDPHPSLLPIQGEGVRQILCFGGAFLDAPTWTNRQHVISQLAEHYPVLYVEPRIWIARAPRRWLRRRWRVMIRGPQFFVIAQWNLIPGSREWRWISRLNHAINQWCVMRSARKLGFWHLSPITNRKSQTIVWIYDTEAAEYLDSFPDATVVYDCVDDHASQAGVDRNPRRVAEEEAAIMQRADLVTVTSRRLYELKRHQNGNVHLVLNAGDVTAYEKPIAGTPTELATLERPIIGTVGTLDAYKFDFELLRDIAASRPAWQFVLIGEPLVDARAARQRGLSELLALPNVHSFGSRPWRDVPRYVVGFDVCIIPYRNSRYNAASFPLKFWEFMASGKPIVAAGVPELKAYCTYIEYAENADEFIAGIEQALRGGGAGAHERKALAREHSWEKRVERLVQLLWRINKTKL